MATTSYRDFPSSASNLLPMWVWLGAAISIPLLALWLSKTPELPSPIDARISISRPIAEERERASLHPDHSPHSKDRKPSHASMEDVLAIAQDAKQSIDAHVKDYTATMVKRERVRGALGEESQVYVKIMSRQIVDGTLIGPLRVYLRFEAPSEVKGREVIWVENQNNGKLVAHQPGFLNLTNLYLDPHGILAMRGNKYPISDIGIANLTSKLIEKGERFRSLKSCQVAIVDGQHVGDRTCRMIQVTLPERRPEFDFHIAQVFIDTERKIPLRYAAYLWPERSDEEPPLEEEYTFLDLQVNVGLTESDFDIRNPNYEFPK